MSHSISDQALDRLLRLGRPLADETPAEAASLGFEEKYRVVREVGRGGLGTVYEAVDRWLGRRVAIKVLTAGGAADFELRQRFEHEARAATRLTHPNIARVLEIHSRYIVMQFIAGETLATADRSAPERLVRWVREAALAVHYAHQQGLVHRDLKPQNLMVASATDGLYVMDFGLALRLDSRAGGADWGRVLGTPAYMSPEQARGRVDEVGPRSDVYSLGATLYELLSNRRPFDGESSAAVLEQVVHAEPVPLATRAPLLDPRLGAIATSLSR